MQSSRVCVESCTGAITDRDISFIVRNLKRPGPRVDRESSERDIRNLLILCVYAYRFCFCVLHFGWWVDSFRF